MKIQNDINGWIVVDKPYQTGSTDVVRLIKKTLHPKKIGHAGTLDPLATGVLPLALGKATRTIEFVMDGQKRYEFTVRFGKQTSTDDAEGEVIATSYKIPTKEEIEKVIPSFIGDVDQMPPAYSALKVDGKRAYELVRKGQMPDLKSRKIRIDSLKFLGFENETDAMFEVECGKGTYVRCIGRDLALALGSVGYLTRLRRTKCAVFDIKNTITLEKIKDLCYNNISDVLVPVKAVLTDILELAINGQQARALSQGQSLPLVGFKELKEGALYQATFDGELIAFVKVEGGKIRPSKVFI